ncbi:DinB family protein [Oceanobacillus kapialis]|uniref:DinB family protein n=1 Tax=Oceanobacillus kapialis TaxID=481353 RepID=A0ABW5Q0S7_9BACI
MYTIKDLFQDLKDYREWITTLHNIQEELFFEPIAEEKWTIAEIITHIAYWDHYILHDMMPQMAQDADIHSIDIETLNKKAEAHARSGIGQQQILEEQLQARDAMLTALKEKDEAFFATTFELNGESVDEHSGYPHSVFNYFSGFVWHDNHHRRQIESFLERKGLSVG